MALLILLITGTVLLGSILVIIFIFSATIWGDLQGAPFVRSRKDRIRTMLELADIRQGTRVLELGSGDATLVIAAAKKGANAQGVEINPFLVWYSGRKIKRAGLQANIQIIREDFYHLSLSEKNPDVVFLYLLPRTLQKIKEKLLVELKPGTRIISNAFHIEGFTPSLHRDGVYLYRL